MLLHMRNSLVFDNPCRRLLPLGLFISSPLNVDRRPAGTEPCARTQMPAGRLKELIVSFCGGSDPHRHRWRQIYYTKKFGGAGFTPVFPIPTFNTAISRSAAVDRRCICGYAWAVDRFPGVPLRRLLSFIHSSARRSSALNAGLRISAPARVPLVSGSPLRRNAVSMLVGTTLKRDLRFENGVNGKWRSREDSNLLPAV